MFSLSSGVSNSLMALVPLQHSPADQGTPLSAAWQSILVWLVGKVITQGLIPAGVWGVLTQRSDPYWGVGSPSLMYCFT